MKRLAMAIAVSVCVWADAALAQSARCCATADDGPYAGLRCRPFGPESTAGCMEIDDNNSCIGGNPASGRACLCLGPYCVTDTSLRELKFPPTADADDCTDAAVSACCDAASCEPGARQPIQACAGGRQGFGYNKSCATGCCLTILPVPNAAKTGSGLCVDATECNRPPVQLAACSGAEVGFAPNDRQCGLGGCCATLVPRTAGLCVDPVNCEL